MLAAPYGTEARSANWLASLMARDDFDYSGVASLPELEAWITSMKIKSRAKTTLYNYWREVALLLRSYPDTAFADFTPEQIETVLADKPESSRYITFSVFSTWFPGASSATARQEPDGKLDRPRTRTASRGHLRRGRGRRARDAAEPDRALCTLLFCSGMRQGGARELRLEHVTSRRHGAVIEKGNEPRDRAAAEGDAAVVASRSSRGSSPATTSGTRGPAAATTSRA